MVAAKHVLRGIILGAAPCCCWAAGIDRTYMRKDLVDGVAVVLDSAELPRDTVLQFIREHETITIQVVRSKKAWLGVGFGHSSITFADTPFVVGFPEMNEVRGRTNFDLLAVLLMILG